MKAADLNRFLVVCALVSDLCCPGYNPRQSLEKNSNLARTATLYKVDSTKIATVVRSELSTKPNQPRKQPNAPIATERHNAGKNKLRCARILAYCNCLI
jgi:hypothetical protein